MPRGRNDGDLVREATGADSADGPSWELGHDAKVDGARGRRLGLRGGVAGAC